MIARLRSLLGKVVRRTALEATLLLPAPAEAGRLVMLPTMPRYQSSLLRVYLIAEALRAHGWASVVVDPRLPQSARLAAVKRFRPDFVFVQKSRHPLNVPELMAGWPLVYDIDDADFLTPELTERIARTCAMARGVIAGSRHVGDWCSRHASRVEVIWTGTPVSPGPRRAHAERQPLVTWAQAEPATYPDELAFVTDVMTKISARCPDARLRLYGGGMAADDAPLRAMRAAGVAVETMPPMPYDAFLRSLQDVAVGLSPICVQSPFSRGKSFGKVLGYLDAMTPVIVSDEAEHGAFFDGRNGVLSNDPAVWVERGVELLSDPALREAMAGRAFEGLQAELTIEAAARKVDAFLRSLEA